MIDCPAAYRSEAGHIRSMSMSSNLQNRNGGSVLVVFNDNERWKEYGYYFSEEGIDVDVVNLAETAMEKVRESDYDIIIVEDYLPDSPGYILAARILREKISLIFMIGKSLSDVEVVCAYKTGINDYLTFDIPAMRLAAKCRSVINFNRVIKAAKKSIPEDGVITKSGLSLNTNNGEVKKKNGQIIALVKHEAEVLRVLMENAGKEMSKQEIYEQAWKMPYIEGENSVANHVAKLRKKIEDNEKYPQFILTKWGFGYSFNQFVS